MNIQCVLYIFYINICTGIIVYLFYLFDDSYLKVFKNWWSQPFMHRTIPPYTIFCCFNISCWMYTNLSLQYSQYYMQCNEALKTLCHQWRLLGFVILRELLYKKRVIAFLFVDIVPCRILFAQNNILLGTIFTSINAITL